MAEKKQYDIKAIDLGANLFTEEVVGLRPAWCSQFYTGKFSVKEKTLPGVTLEEMIAKMDRAGIEIALLIACKVGPLGPPQTWHLPYETVIFDGILQPADTFHPLGRINAGQSAKTIRIFINSLFYNFVG